MIFATPAIILPCEKPAIVRASDLKGLPSWQEMQRRERAIKEGTFPFPVFVPSASGITLPTFIGAVTGSATVTSAAKATTATAPIGSRIIVCVGGATTGQTVTGISDGVNTYTKAGGAATSGVRYEIWYSDALSAALTSGTTITASFSGNFLSEWFLSLCYVSGLAASPFDLYANANVSATTAPTVSTGTMAQANSLVLGNVFGYTSAGVCTITEASGYTRADNSNGFGSDVASYDVGAKIVSATTTTAYNPTGNVNLTGGIQVAVFKGA